MLREKFQFSVLLCVPRWFNSTSTEKVTCECDELYGLNESENNSHAKHDTAEHDTAQHSQHRTHKKSKSCANAKSSISHFYLSFVPTQTSGARYLFLSLFYHVYIHFSFVSLCVYLLSRYMRWVCRVVFCCVHTCVCAFLCRFGIVSCRQKVQRYSFTAKKKNLLANLLLEQTKAVLDSTNTPFFDTYIALTYTRTKR